MAITKSRRDLQEHVSRFEAAEGKELLADDRHGTRDDHRHGSQHRHREGFSDDTRR